MQLLLNIKNRFWSNVLYKFSPIFTSLYVIAYFGDINSKQLVFILFLSLAVSIGIAGLGYTLNDLLDYKDDLLNKKKNLFLELPAYQKYVLILLFLLMTFFPWVYLPFNKTSFYLLLTEFLLFILYVMPPFRLKEKGFLGILADALYAQVIPCLLATHTFLKFTDKPIVSVYFLIIYLLWLLIAGIRNIIKHQIEDFSNDTNSNTNTFVTQYGIEFSVNLNLRLLIPLEILLFLSLLFSLSFKFHLAIVLFFIYALFLLYNWSTTRLESLYNYLNTRILNEFYEIHLPLILLFYFSWIKPDFLWITLLNLIVFSSVYLLFFREFVKKYLNI